MSYKMKQDKKKKNKTSKIRKWINITLWSGFLFVLLCGIGIFIAISKGHIGYMPDMDQLENPIERYASQIISADGVLLGRYSTSKDNRINVKYKDLSPALVHALIATEDNRYVKHSGIDVKGLARAIIKRGLLMQKSGGGGSTITQQLAKQLFSPNVNNISERILQKPIEWVIAIRLEKYYTKEEIINLYLNKFDFLYNAVGIESASHVYFSTTPSNLKIEEAATLIGMCKNPSYYNPRRFAERAQGRRNTVLFQMHKYGYLEKSVRDSLVQLPIELKYTTIDHKEGLAPYYREYMRVMLSATKPERKNYNQWNQQKFVEDSISWETNPMYGWCNKTTPKADGSPYNIYTDGLKIYTTLDSRMQQYAEEAVREHMGNSLQPRFVREKRGRRNAPFNFSGFSAAGAEAEMKRIMTSAINRSDRYRNMKSAEASDEEIERAFNTKTEMTVFSWKGDIDTIMTPRDSILYYKTFLRTGFMSMDARTGHVKAYVGGIDFARFQYDMVTTGRRQVGSTMKPFVYSYAMAENFTPCSKLLHVRPEILLPDGSYWRPNNSTNSRLGEEVTLQWGLQQSSNWITANLMNYLSPYALERYLRSYGFKGPIDPVPAMCLGTPDISVSEMVSAYTVFTNKGIRIEPIYITHIDDSYGNTVANFAHQTVEVLSVDVAYKMLNMLQKVVDGGTAGRVRSYGIRAPMGGKTGTTNNHSDAWFIGFTPNLVAGCWVGGEEPYIHFDSMADGQGASAALPIYALFMQKVFKDPNLGYSEKDVFDIPEEYLDPCSSGGGRNTGASSARRNASGLNSLYD